VSTAIRVLVVEDDPQVANLVRRYLEHEGFVPTVVDSGNGALSVAREKPFDIVILDWVLPDLSGIDVCRQLRADSDVPILFLTARTEDVDKIVGLTVGGDDYLTKPFSPRELVARIQAILRRTRPAARNRVVIVGDLTVDFPRRVARKGERVLALTPLEYSLLWTLAQRPGVVYTRNQLLAACWGSSSYCGDLHVVDVHVANLRKKIEDDPAVPRYVQTVRSVGYRLGEP